MNLAGYVKNLQEQLAVAAEAGGREARELAGRLTSPLDAATRLILLEALSNAADEITRELAPGSVEVRLRGGEPEFVVTPPPTEEEFEGPGLEELVPTDESGTARLNLRLPESLKQRIEDAASAEGLSLNAWLVRAASTALGTRPSTSTRQRSGGDRYTGWVR